jgi:hypothetical protein
VCDDGDGDGDGDGNGDTYTAGHGDIGYDSAATPPPASFLIPRGPGSGCSAGGAIAWMFLLGPGLLTLFASSVQDF